MDFGVTTQSRSPKRSGSSVWLEYMPVTHGVASSSLVRTAKQRRALSDEGSNRMECRSAREYKGVLGSARQMYFFWK